MSPDSIRQSKTRLRRNYRRARREMPEELRAANDRAINLEIQKFCSEQNAEKIAGYLAFDGEPEISTALAALGSADVNIFLPIIGAGENDNALGFRRWAIEPESVDDRELRPNRYGIQEPIIGELCDVADLDLILIPLVAWDRDGGRLGMGAGYYDRALAPVSRLARPVRVGVAYEIQCDVSLPVTELDISLHGVVTEKGLFTFRA